MSGNSLESLLARMKDGSLMLNWGLIVAFDRHKANRLIAQEYIRRFGAGSYLPAIEAEVEIVENQWSNFIHDYVMSVPKLSFENADLNDSKAMLSMAVMGGSQFNLKRESVGWKAIKVDEIDPLQGPRLYLDLLLNEVPGDVANDGRVRLDLSRSDNFRLTFGETPHEQRIGGNFFKDLFNQLPDDQRIYTLGTIKPGLSPLLSPISFDLRTQASSLASRDPQSAEHGDGALLALVRTLLDAGGNFPGASYPYLIPDDSETDYSATVLFDRTRLAASLLLDELLRSVDGDRFEYEFDEEGELVLATLSKGEIVVEESSGIIPTGWGDIQYKVGELVFPADDSNRFTVRYDEGKLIVNWSTQAISDWVFTSAETEDPYVEKRLFTIELRMVYDLEEVDGGELFLVRSEFNCVPNSYVIESLDANPIFWGAVLIAVISFVLLGIVIFSITDGRLMIAFFQKMSAKEPFNDYINKTIELYFGEAIQGDEAYAPLDIGFFGRINPTLTSFAISPMEPLLHQGSTLQFRTDPVVTGVQWKAENLIEGPDNPGSINSSGLYQAPPASAITGRYTRVRVTATDPATGFFSSALVTVVINELTVNPLIQICDLGAAVELAAGHLGTGALQWSIKNLVAGESGELRPSDHPEGDHTYHHGPVVANKTFVLDEIEVKSGAGPARSVHVLALQKAPFITVSITSIDTQKGQVKLQAIVNGDSWDAEWSLPLGGPGTVDTKGLYQALPTANERFALIFALIDGGPLGKLEGYLILPLPLVEFPALLEVLKNE